MPPTDQLIRARIPGLELRAAEEDGGMPRLTGYMLRFNEWAEIDSVFEGHFMERIAPGAITKTMQENRDSIKILFQHGMDPTVGEKPIAPSELIADERGLRYDDPELFDAGYVRDLVPALKASQFGSSFKFTVTSEDFNKSPERSDENPEGIPERTITEMRLYEGGPVTFPAYEGSSAGVRSLTDRFRHYTFEEAEELFESWVKREPERVRALLLEKPAEKDSKDTSDDSASNSDQHSHGAEKGSHSKAGRSKSKFRTLAKPAPEWQLSNKE